MISGHFYDVHSSVRWDPAVEAYFAACFGAPRLAAISSALAKPSLTPTLRVNTLRSKPEEVVQKLQRDLWMQQQQRSTHSAEAGVTRGAIDGEPGDVVQAPRARACARSPAPSVIPCGPAQAPGCESPPPLSVMADAAKAGTAATARLHSRVPAAVLLAGRGPCDVEFDPGMPEVVIHRFAGEAVLKGAHVYAPGVLAASAGIAAGNLVAVSAALERPTGHHTRCRGDGGGLAAGRLDETGGEAVRAPEITTNGSMCASGRLAIGISRGAKVAPDGAVSLAWARQPMAKQRQHVQSRQRGWGRFQQQQQQQLELKLVTADGEEGYSGGDVSSSNGTGDSGAREGSSYVRDAGYRACSRSSSSGGSSSGTGDGGSKTIGTFSSTMCSSSSSNRDSACSRRQERVFLGVARAAMGRRALFRAQEGLALKMERRVYEVPSCNGLLKGEMMLQALPSIVAAQVLRPRPGSRVLDMCAAPGGKTTLLAALMEDRGRVVALDRTAAKVEEIRSLARDLGVTCVEAHQADAAEAAAATVAATAPDADAAAPDAAEEHPTLAAMAAAPSVAASMAFAGGSRIARAQPPRETAAAATAATLSSLLGPPPYPAGSFDYVLLDPPCSALGLRPRLLHSWGLPQLRAMAAYQRSLVHTAIQLLAPGGEMVYCTCTINPDENEANVAWALDRFPGTLELLPAEPLLGLPGLTGADPDVGTRWLTEREADLVQRFDPGLLLPDRRMALAAATTERLPTSGGPNGEQPLESHAQKPGMKTERRPSNVQGGKTCIAGGELQGSMSREAAEEEAQGERQEEFGEGPSGGIAATSQEGGVGLEVEAGDDVMGFFIARFRKVL